MSVRAELIQLISELPDEALPEAERLLDGLHRRCLDRHTMAADGDRPQAALGAPYSSLDYLIANATDLGPDVSSEDPHGFAGRGKRWFEPE